jgi:peptidoglycan/LPS O-acetylase OafA/YrhL
MKIYNKLDQLTSLRFFAALMIVIHHATGMFGIKNIGVNWGQGVSFFFVLSGFILTYVYPNIDTFVEIKKFWLARIARIYPAYLFSFIIGFFLLHYSWDTKTLIANIFMIHAWIPISNYYFSYNSVSWSVSTEVFFYIFFPFLLYKWNYNWKFKIIISILILIFIIYMCDFFKIPLYEQPKINKDAVSVTRHGLIYINPISRIFEFIFGMTIASLWTRNRLVINFYVATFLEIIAIIFCAISMINNNIIHSLIIKYIQSPSANLWFIHSGSFLSFGFLIYIIASGNGLISAILKKKELVLLGEISFSMYLIHQILIRVFKKNYTVDYSQNFMYFVFFIMTLLILSYLIWAYIERPGRKLILKINT